MDIKKRDGDRTCALGLTNDLKWVNQVSVIWCIIANGKMNEPVASSSLGSRKCILFLYNHMCIEQNQINEKIKALISGSGKVL